MTFIMFWAFLFFLTNTVFALPSRDSLTPTSASSATLQKPFYAVSDQDVLAAHCRQTDPVPDQKIIEWLTRKAQYEDANLNSVPDANVLGLMLINESPYLIHLLEELLTNEIGFNFPQKTYSSQCHRVVCVVQELFGERVGLQLLYLLGRYGFNGSHLRIQNADLWTHAELDVVLLSLSDLPPHLLARPPVAMNHPLVHFNRSDVSPDRPMANAIIYIFNGWNQQTASRQRYSLFHELGHNMGFDFGFDSLRAWYQAADWSEKDFEWIQLHPERKISQYAESNPDEDFAESFAAYRYNPTTLKKISPKVYQFMKKTVFRNIEYTSEAACQSHEISIDHLFQNRVDSFFGHVQSKKAVDVLRLRQSRPR
jgi:hypothetical protein